MGQNLILNMNDHGFVVSQEGTLLWVLGAWRLISKILYNLELRSLRICPVAA